MPDKNHRSYTDGDSDTRRESDQTTESTSHRKKSKKRTSDSKSKYWPSPTLTRRITLCTEAGLLVVGVAYTFFACYQWRAMRAQVAITQAQLQSIRDEQRAWVSPVLTRLANPLAVGQKPTATIECRNTGKSLAFDVQITGQIM